MLSVNVNAPAVKTCLTAEVILADTRIMMREIGICPIPILDTNDLLKRLIAQCTTPMHFNNTLN